VNGAIVETVCIDAGHPCLAGHFPDNPVVPGVVLLDRVVAVLEQHGCGRLAGLDVVKFSLALRPDQQALLRLDRVGTRVRFSIERDGRTLASGSGDLA
jgi:3-hydroxymyristoyl/3-hydroxydecanoyl-(acyl carrier protein) dehydratase